MEDYEPIISDGQEDYFSFSKTPEGYKEIVLKCIQEILRINTSLLSSTGKIYLKVQGQIITQEENTLKIYYQLIDVLEDMLLYYFDDKATEEITRLDKNKLELYPHYLKLYQQNETNENSKYKSLKTGVIPHNEGLGKYYLECYEEDIKKYYRSKFRALLLLFKRKNDLSGKRIASMAMPVRVE